MTKQKQPNIPAVQTWAFIQPLYDITFDGYCPTTHRHAVQYTVYLWNFKKQRWTEGKNYYDDYDEAKAEAKQYQEKMLKEYQIAP